MRATRWGRLVAMAMVLALAACAREADEAAEMEGEPAGGMEATAVQTAGPTEAEVTASMERLRTDWTEAANRDDTAAVADMYAEDAIFVDFFGREHRGREAIRAWLGEAVRTGSDLTVTETWSTVVDGVQISTGTWSQTVTAPDGTETPMEGIYHVTSRLMDDGTPRILAHTSAVPQEPPQGM